MEDKIYEQDLKRPWGGYIVFADNEQVTCKILFLKKGERLSIQSHRLREENWYVISGKVRVFRGPVRDSVDKIKKELKSYELGAGENILIGQGMVHAMEGIEDSKVLEIMRGKYDEDDIIRYEDLYGRT